jgi:hypothetical protein
VNGKLRNVSAKTEREVVAKRRLALSQPEDAPSVGSITVAEMADRWLSTLSDPLSLNYVAPVAVSSYRSVVRCHIRLLSAGLFDNALASLGEDGSAALSEDARRRRPVGMVTSDRRRGDARLFSCV